MCGIMGIYCKKGSSDDECECATNLIEGLFHLQHRGQDSCGIHMLQNQELYTTKGQGMIHSVFTQEKLSRMKGNMGIGHVRYPTKGLNTLNEQKRK